MTAPNLRAPAVHQLAVAALLALLVAAGAVQAAPFAYITNSATSKVVVLDIATNTVVASVPVPGSPQAVALNRAGTRAYVPSYDLDTLSVIDTGTNTVIATVPVGLRPIGVAVNPAGTRVYVTNNGAYTVSVIDTAANTVIATIPVPAYPIEVVVNPAGTRAYVVNGLSVNGVGNSVSVIDTASNAIVATIPAGSSPRGIAVNPAGSRVFVASYIQSLNSYGLLVIDTATNSVLRKVRLTLPNPPHDVAINPAGTRVYVTSPNSVTVTDAATCNSVIATIPLSGGRRLAVSPAGNRAFVTESLGGLVAELDIINNTVLGSVEVGVPRGSPHGIAFSYGEVVPPVPAPIRVTGIEVTQGIQDVANSVPLILGRRTTARVYVKSDGPAIAGVTATLSGLGSYVSGGSTVSVPLGPLVPSNVNGPRITVQPDPKRSIGDDGFLFELPWQWSSFAGLKLHAVLSEPDAPPAGSCDGEVAAAPLVEFRTFITLKVAFVRMGYALPGMFPIPSDALAQASLDEQRRSESWISRTYPVSQLSFAPDLTLFDPFLGAFVDQSALFCTFLAADEKNQCAYYYVSSLLSQLSTTSNFMDGADVAYGLIPQPNPNPRQLFTRGACCDGRSGAGPANDDDYAAHEIGHFLGRRHPVQAAGPMDCKHTADDPNYPYFYTFIAPPLSDPNTSLAGFDSGDASLLLPQRFLSPASSFDIMGYCAPTTWISDYTYRALAISLQTLHPGVGTGAEPAAANSPRALAVPPQLGDWLLVFGQVAPDLASATLFNTRRVDRIVNQPPRPPGDFSIRLVDGAGATLADYSFAPVAIGDAGRPGGVSAARLGFGHAVPFVSGTRAVRIIRVAGGGSVLATLPVSANAPVVGSVAAGAPDAATGLLPLSWSASDADGDNLRFDLQVVRDNGNRVLPLRLGLAQGPASIETLALGGGPVRFRVIASDGLQTAFADSPVVVLDNRPPQVRILAPAANAHVYLGQAINLEGDAMDPQDGAISGAGLAWSSAQGALGTGGRASVANLPVGVHVLTLTATNSLGLVATRTVTVAVDGNLAARGPTLTAGPGQIGWQVGVGEVLAQTATLDVSNSGSGILQFALSGGAPWLTPSAPGGTAPTTITFTANPAGLADGTILDTTVTLTAIGVPGQVITIPVRLAVGGTFDIGNALPPLRIDLVHGDGFENPVATQAPMR